MHPAEEFDIRSIQLAISFRNYDIKTESSPKKCARHECVFGHRQVTLEVVSRSKDRDYINVIGLLFGSDKAAVND